MPQPPTPPAPRRDLPQWPTLAAGGAGLAAVAALGAASRADLRAEVLALILVGAATALALLAQARAARRRRTAPLQAASVREPPPYLALVNALPDPILVISAAEAEDLTSRRYIFANAAARELLRIPAEAGGLLTVIRDPQVLEAVDEALFGGLEASCAYELGGAQARALHAHARPLGLAPDGARLALLVLRDETELRRVEQTRVDFLANASHELRTPLASLSGFIETLRGHARHDEDARDRFLGIMQAQAERMSRLIDDLLSLSRIELNEHIAPADEVDLSLALTDVVDAAAPLARERGVSFDLALPPKGAARVLGDRDQLIQVAQNLVDNALKYSTAGAVVRIALVTQLTAEGAAAGLRPEAARLSLLTPDHAADTYAALRVSDAGAGIAREHLPRLTERFYRVEGQKSGERAGTGLGLAIVKHIANRHRGGMAVESALGEGTTFTVYLPQLPALVEPTPTPAVTKAS
ncbi:MAG: ATP-binding protein [Phenylobacterium sp.]